MRRWCGPCRHFGYGIDVCIDALVRSFVRLMMDWNGAFIWFLHGSICCGANDTYLHCSSFTTTQSRPQSVVGDRHHCERAYCQTRRTTELTNNEPQHVVGVSRPLLWIIRSRGFASGLVLARGGRLRSRGWDR